MPFTVDRASVRRLLEHDRAQLAEVLPRGEYDEEHLPGAVHVPLKELNHKNRRGVAPLPSGHRLLLGRVVRHEPAAAWRLERLGFQSVYDYTLGKVDWMAAALPTVRADRSERRAVDDLEHDPPTCARAYSSAWCAADRPRPPSNRLRPTRLEEVPLVRVAAAG
jgi:rhodanese-related sulfurtransferase